MQQLPKYSPSTRKELLRLYANFYGWRELPGDDNTLTFTRGSCILNAIIPTLSILTTLNHKKRGRKTLERHGLDFDTIKGIFKNPRVHTGKGYY
jgi:hypothetical protein